MYMDFESKLQFSAFSNHQKQRCKRFKNFYLASVCPLTIFQDPRDKNQEPLGHISFAYISETFFLKTQLSTTLKFNLLKHYLERLPFFV